MNNNIIDQMAEAMLKQAYEETMSEPMMKMAGEGVQMDGIAEKLAYTLQEAIMVKQAAEEEVENAEAQEELGRAALEEQGVDPDAFIEAVEENAEDEDEEEEDEEEDE